jgi:hypothetical protein
VDTDAQGGFTTDVTCEFQDLTNSVSLWNDTVEGWTTGQELGHVYYWELDSNSTNCGIVPGSSAVNAVNWTSAYTVENTNYFLMIACGGVSDNFCESNLQAIAYLMLTQR